MYNLFYCTGKLFSDQQAINRSLKREEIHFSLRSFKLDLRASYEYIKFGVARDEQEVHL
jgi:hypothetical protein